MKSNIGKVWHTARLLCLVLLLSLCSSFWLSLPASATDTTYNLGNYRLLNQAMGTPTTSYRFGSGSFGTATENGMWVTPAIFNNSTDTPIVIRQQMRGSNNQMPELRNPSLIEYTMVTNNLAWRGSANVSQDFLPLGCELTGTVGAYSGWSCIAFNSDSAGGGSNHYLLAGNWWSITNTGYNAFVQVVDWRQYVADDETDYTSLLQDIRANTADTSTISGQIRNQLISLNTTTTNIYTILQTINDRLQSVNQSATNQAQQDSQDRNDAEQVVDDSQDSAESASEEVGTATASLTQTIGAFAATFSTPSSNCQIPLNDLGPDGIFDIGSIDLCAIPDQMHSLITTILNLIAVAISIALAVNTFRMITEIIGMFAGVGFGYERHYQSADSWTTAGLINQWSSGHDFEA